MSEKTDSEFFKALNQRSGIIQDYILDKRFIDRFNPDDVKWAVCAYVKYGGKRLRPAILLFSCGAVGADEAKAIPAAAAVEIFHTWTLVHDDIIDRDSLRRGNSTVHQYYLDRTLRGAGEFKLSPEEAKHYGVSIAILTGDIQHGWGISLMAELTTLNDVDPMVTLDLINELDTKVLNTLVEGEVLDIQYAHLDIESLTPAMIEDMLWKKTGALYEFCGSAGAMIGLGKRDHPYVDTVARFAALCGTAFQLQDDILGVIGDVKTIGKPVGSDLREGKRTLVIYYAYHNAGSADKKKLLSVLGNAHAKEKEIDSTIELLKNLGGNDIVKQRAQTLIEEALPLLESLPETNSRELLSKWANFLINRDL